MNKTKSKKVKKTQRHKTVTRGIEQIVELTRQVREQHQRSSDRIAAIEDARRQIASRGEFIPKLPGINGPVKVCF